MDAGGGFLMASGSSFLDLLLVGVEEAFLLLLLLVLLLLLLDDFFPEEGKLASEVVVAELPSLFPFFLFAELFIKKQVLCWQNTRVGN